MGAHQVLGIIPVPGAQKAVGDHIASFGREQGEEGLAWERRLWRFVSQATENSLDGEKLHSVYVKVVGAPLSPDQMHSVYVKAVGAP